MYYRSPSFDALLRVCRLRRQFSLMWSPLCTQRGRFKARWIISCKEEALRFDNPPALFEVDTCVFRTRSDANFRVAFLPLILVTLTGNNALEVTRTSMWSKLTAATVNCLPRRLNAQHDDEDSMPRSCSEDASLSGRDLSRAFELLVNELDLPEAKRSALFAQSEEKKRQLVQEQQVLQVNIDSLCNIYS